MVEAKRPAVDEPEAPPAKRSNGGSGALEEDLEAELDAEQDQLAEEDVDAMMFDDDIELHLGEAGRNWERPEPTPHNPKSDRLGQLVQYSMLLHRQLFWQSAMRSNLVYDAMALCSIPAAGGRLYYWSSQ